MDSQISTLKITVLLASSYEFLFACNNLLYQSYIQAHLLSCVTKRFCPDAFRQDLNNDIKMSHPGQSHNVVIYNVVVLTSNIIHDREDVNLISPIAHFSPPISFYMPDIFMQVLCCCMRNFSCYMPITRKEFRRCPWCNGYRRRKWIRWH